MNEIRYMVKPEWVSWDSISECQRLAHKTNNAKGFHMKVQDMTGEEINRFIGDGVCFIALDGNTVVGITALVKKKINRWWVKGNVALLSCMTAVLPEYRNTDVNLELVIMRNEFWKKSNVETMYLSTAEDNKLIQKMARRTGAKYVQYSASGKGATYYSVVMARWKNGCSFPDWFCSFMFWLSKILIRTIWKPGYIFRLSAH